MEEERPGLPVDDGGNSQKENVVRVNPTTGLTGEQPSKVIEGEKRGFVAGIRRAWGRFTAEHKPPEDSWGKGF